MCFNTPGKLGEIDSVNPMWLEQGHVQQSYCRGAEKGRGAEDHNHRRFTIFTKTEIQKARIKVTAWLTERTNEKPKLKA